MTDRANSNVPIATGWRRSSYSNSEGGSCVEVLDGYSAGVPVRDSKLPNGPSLIFPTAGWASFIAALKDTNGPR
ncbi:DUF397 domain-containing protein [Streptomyces sp. NPDC002513]